MVHAVQPHGPGGAHNQNSSQSIEQDLEQALKALSQGHYQQAVKDLEKALQQQQANQQPGQSQDGQGQDPGQSDPVQGSGQSGQNEGAGQQSGANNPLDQILNALSDITGKHSSSNTSQAKQDILQALLALAQQYPSYGTGNNGSSNSGNTNNININT
jgi:outer membrane protein OmpA-like peptidoglycan-associated protein